MKIVFCGNWRPAWSTENDWRKAFEALGHEVVQVQEDEVPSIPWLRAVIYEAAPACFVYVRTWGLPDELTDLLVELEAAGIPSVSPHLDLYYELGSEKGRGIQRYDLPAVDPQFRCTYVFTADFDHQDLFARDGVNHIPLMPGVNHEEAIDCPPYEDGESIPVVGGEPLVFDARWQVGFCGSRLYHPEWQHRPQLVEWLRDTYGRRFVHIGERSTIRGLALNRLYASVPVWVGDSCKTAPDRGYVSDRWTETWGRGGFLIHPRVEMLIDRYGDVPGLGWTVGDWAALADEVDHWLACPEARDKMRRRIASQVRGCDTYLVRVTEMLVAMA